MADQRLNETQLRSLNRCQLYRSSDYSISNNSWNSVPMNAEDYDPNNMHDLSTNPDRITIKESGWYGFGGVIRYADSTNGGIKITRYNSSGTEQRGGVMSFYSSAINILNCYKEFYLNAGDFLVLRYYAISGSVITGSQPENEAETAFWYAMRSK